MSKKLKIVVFVLFIGLSSYSQQFLFKTTSLSVTEMNSKGKWTDWTKPVKSEMIIKIDGVSHRVVVYSEEIQLFNIVKYNEVKKTETDILSSYNCVDNNGIECVVSVYTRLNQNNRKQLYITYDDMIIEYNIEIEK
ncbi:hypothetical protein [uncultured Flavobacterium sp.]|uniref:hypothetical protein n=1 Tax=uncultured Flavobacterium sp. TaxID=165435 RepID=UPI0030ED5FCF|tara:strand:- start:187256 stop:187663 length:408 start_codon:yes stop_codon:yes gene_type:complete